MSELNEMWSQMLAEASKNARASDRHDVADYLDLKASNDLVRRAGVEWLFETIIEHAADANRGRTAVAIERTEPHSFQFRGANIVGTRLDLRYGVRCLTVEAGWTRTPADGFMRGGGLAFARFRHFGIPRANIEAALLRADQTPAWKELAEEGLGAELRSDSLHQHVRLLTQS